MGLMGGGLWGVGFVTVDMRIRKLLKRFVATPMKRSHFLAGIMISRLVFMVPEVLILLVFCAAGVRGRNSGQPVAVVVLISARGVHVCGHRPVGGQPARTLETVSGLMNLVMLPMWVLSGIFFSSERFPEAVQPVHSSDAADTLDRRPASRDARRRVVPADRPAVGRAGRLGHCHVCACIKVVPLDVTKN